MTINFNIPDDIGADYILAAHWKLPDPGFTDEQVVKKYLKKCIGLLIDDYKKETALAEDRALVKSLQLQLAAASAVTIEKRKNYDATTPPTDVGP
jgi:hypothetical protein